MASSAGRNVKSGRVGQSSSGSPLKGASGIKKTGGDGIGTKGKGKKVK